MDSEFRKFDCEGKERVIAGVDIKFRSVCVL